MNLTVYQYYKPFCLTSTATKKQPVSFYMMISNETEGVVVFLLFKAQANSYLPKLGFIAEFI